VIINDGSGLLTIAAMGSNNIWENGIQTSTYPIAMSGVAKFYANGENWIIL